MNLFRMLFAVVVATAALVAAGPVQAAVESPVPSVGREATVEISAPVPALPGTPDEAQEYERREAASPEVQEYAGGAIFIGVGLLGLVLIVIIVILLTD